MEGIIMGGIQLSDPLNVTDIFASGLGEVEDLDNGCFRFTLYSAHHIDGREQRTVVARLILPASAVPPAILLAAKAVGYSVAAGAYFPRQHLH